MIQLDFATPAQGWNPRYVVYARVHGRTPEEQIAHDRAKRPGASMVGFMLWISRQWRAWFDEQEGMPRWKLSCLALMKGPAEHASYDARLKTLGPCEGCPACEDP